MPSVRSWLSELGLESYWGLIEGCGYNTVESLRSVTKLEWGVGWWWKVVIRRDSDG